MSQPPTVPPPYEYNKPPAYHEAQSQNVGGPSVVQQQPPYPTQPYPVYPPPPQGHTNPTVISVTTTPAYPAPGQTQVLILGDCPNCRIGFLRNDFDICGIVLAIVFFPIGVLCCLCMMERRCSHCGYRP